MESMNNENTPVITDSIVLNVIKEFASRAEVGQNKYGTNMDRKDLSIDQWLVHLKEEMMDALIYLEKVRVEFDLLMKELETIKKSNSMTIKYNWHR